MHDTAACPYPLVSQKVRNNILLSFFVKAPEDFFEACLSSHCRQWHSQCHQTFPPALDKLWSPDRAALP